MEVYVIVLDIDECTEGTSVCQQGCDNTEGGYNCSCRTQWYRPDGQYNCTGQWSSLIATESDLHQSSKENWLFCYIQPLYYYCTMYKCVVGSTACVTVITLTNYTYSVMTTCSNGCVYRAGCELWRPLELCQFSRLWRGLQLCMWLWLQTRWELLLICW